LDVKVPGMGIVKRTLTRFFLGENMNYRNAVLFAIAGLLASRGFARADGLAAPALSLDPMVVTADDEAPAPSAPLMAALEGIGIGKALEDANFSISGWIEGGYTFNNRHHSQNGIPPADTAIAPGPFNHEVGNHFMMNQLGLNFERQVDSQAFDVGGAVELLYGTDAAFTHSSGWGFGGDEPTGDDVSVKYRPYYQFDVTQAYVDVNIPIGNGLKMRMGKFLTLQGYEYVNPANNAFYSHSWTFSAAPYSVTGIAGIYSLNDQWSVTAGISRGWDMTMEDNNGAIDGIGSISYAPSSEFSVTLNWNVGPQNAGDNGHWRTVIDPLVSWQVTKELKLGLEALYIYDGGANAGEAGSTHAYGDVWSAAGYVGYALNDYLTLNGRLEGYHSSATSIGAVGAPYGGSLSIYSITLGATITPMPDNSVLKNLTIRPEIRYDFSDSTANKPFLTEVKDSAGNPRSFKDQLVFAVDLVFKF
jgi:hypothetical protein